MDIVRDKVELLAPVGSMESLYAAVQNGADAVYLGGKLFNARQYASNFDYEELREAIKYSHLNGVKVYVTVNILIEDREVSEIMDYIKFLYEADIDAIIVQDLGIANLVRKTFPDFKIHGSTQMTINNLEGAKFLQDMGFSRVVLAREVPLDEIIRIKGNSDIELEVFVHGALCVSYSGQCLMSSLIGGRSGNRGRCAQPCRMAYSIVDKQGLLVGDWDKKHVLSTRDLNTLGYIDRLKDIGISSFKIEGRMKRPEYVATIVKNYRKALDEGDISVRDEDKKDVEQIFNRGFTRGLTFGDFGGEYISFNRPDNRGTLLGKVVKVDKYKVSILLEEDIEKGDGIEFLLANGKYKGMKSPQDGKKGCILILDKLGFISKDSLVYKTSSESLLNSARKSYEENKKMYPVDMEIYVKIDEKPELKLKHREYIVDVMGDFIVERGKKLTIGEEKVREQLSKLGDTSYYLANIEMHIEEGAFLPLSVLNELRRNAIDRLEAIIGNFNNRKPIDNREYNVVKNTLLNIKDRDSSIGRKLSVKISSPQQYRQLNIDKLDRIYLGFYEGLDDIIDELKRKDKEVFIWTDKILYMKDLEGIDRVIDRLKDKLDGVSVSNIGTLKYIRDRYDLKVHGDIGLNIFNSYTVEYLYSLGLDTLTLSPELNLEQIKGISRGVGGSLEAIVYGYLPAMITKTCPMALAKGCKDDSNCKNCNFAKGYGLKDRMDMIFYMTRGNGFSTIYNSVPLMVLDSIGQILDSGVSMARLDFTIEDRYIYEIQSIYYDYINGAANRADIARFIDDYKKHTNITKGHYYRGII
ncbi:MAG: DUF3656 domain-containing protein [Tissierellaceae bacterium]